MLTALQDRLRIMAKTCEDLIKYVDHVNSLGGVKHLDDLYEHAICDCINRLGDSIKIQSLGFDQSLQKTWSGLRVITAHHYHKLDLSKVWTELPKETQALLVVVNEKLK